MAYENADLKRERQNCSFNKEEITTWLDGGADKTRERHEIEELVLSDPALRDDVPTEYLSHADKFAVELKKSCLLIKKLEKRTKRALASGGRSGKGILGPSVQSAILKEGHPLGLHFVMFMPALMGQGTPEQQAKWLPKAFRLEIIGTYAQTEMGHGTFLRGLETKATYDPASREFVLETPTISAYKWWPGGLGQVSNYAVVMAQLHTNGKCEGTHPFVVQLRDEETHEPLPGIDIGEIGPKLGFNSTNNGYLGFKNVRIPRDHMLMKNSQVLEDGTYVSAKNSKLSYGTMVFVRVVIVLDMAVNLRKAVTIATRYSCVRRQSELKPGEPEPQIIEYQAQQNKLFPALAASFAFQFASDYMWKLYFAANDSIGKGDLELLPDLHGLSCAMKALTSTEAANMVETLRQSCGGHGYMACSNFPRIYSICTASETYEGENTVLWLQVARYLIKTVKEKAGGKSVAYLLRAQHTDADLSLRGLVSYFERVAIGLVGEALNALEACARQGASPHDAWNLSAVSLIKAAQAHARYSIAAIFVQSIDEVNFSEPVRRIVSQLCQLLLIHWLTDRSGEFIMYGELTRDQYTALQSTYGSLLAAVRPQALNIVDSFDIRDEILNSALGCWDGNVYQRLFDEAAKSPLNKSSVHRESYEKYLKPLMKSNM